MVNGLGYGYGRFEFRWDATRHAGAAAEKRGKIDDFRRFARRRGRLLGPLWADPAEILGG